MRENIVNIRKSRTATKTSLSVHTFFAELIVTLTLLRIVQDFIGLCRLLKFFLGSFIAGILIGMIFHGYLSVGLLNVGFACVLVDTEYLIVIEICHFFSVFIETTCGNGERELP